MFRATVIGRCFVLVIFTAFVLLDFAPPALIVFGVIDVAAAGWTAMALRADGVGF